MEQDIKIAKDIKVKLADEGIDSRVLVNGEYIPCSYIGIEEQAGGIGMLCITIPMSLVEVLPKEIRKEKIK